MKIRWRDALGIALSVLLLVWTLRGISVAEVWDHLRRANLPLLAGTAVCGTLIFPLRAVRWRIILASVAPALPLGVLWRATAIGMMVNNVVPARAGEIARAYALTRETPRVGFSAAFASLAVDRVFDAFAVLALMLIGTLTSAFPPGQEVAGQPIGRWVGVASAVSIAALAALYLVVFFPDQLIRLFELFARRVAPRIEARGRAALTAFASGLGVLRHPARFIQVLAWTVAHWLTNALAFWLGFRAVGIAAPFSAALLLQGLISIGVAVPSAPGFFGVFEKLGQVGLALYGVSAGLAASWAIGYHIVTFIPITIIGAYYFARLGLHFGELKR